MALATLTRTPDLEAPRPRRRRVSGWHFVLAPVALLFVIPFAQMVLASVSPASDLVKFPPPFIPSALTLDGFVALFTTTDVLRWLLNSVIVSVVAIVSHVILCSLAGYGFARLHLVDSLGAAIVPWLASAFGIFLMRQFFLSLPKEVEEAAAIDGANRLQTFLRIVLPLAKPAIATLAIFTLLSSWNDLIWPLIAINNDDLFTIQLGIANFQGTRRTQWSLLMASNVVATLPLVLFFLFAQKHFVQTMTMSGMKG